ncbi:glucosamine-6-phosphate deaminase [Carboxydochorda subterranea]|uniref:Glucosamine-6-phosphate deaminase n=1 Tax=Carboxydichorda subterranea TaxID=3109565 RepID=A0ABZ1BVP6_9FIRM|nr:glucosamine-6-phosphate deaminase [Limnochorda sp. L945t]WRP16580.1 glucosamine-6-phosphate deaminase [Limnochorda sp. L945t]
MRRGHEMQPVRVLRVDGLTVEVYEDRRQMGAAAAARAERILTNAIASRGQARVAFASAPSQNELLDALVSSRVIDWSCVAAFHLDEYVNLPADAPQSFGRFLRERLFARVRPGEVHFLDGNAADLQAEARRYAALLSQAPLDLALTGIGENGHLAFNEPGMTDFEDRELVRVVELDPRSREQQVHDGCFASLEEVPLHALTLTVPVIMGARSIVCVVPGATKRHVLRQALYGPITPGLPASILRRHPDAAVFADVASASEL